MRSRLRLTQRQFAGWFGFPAATLRHWERGNRQPSGSALVLLCVIRDNPRAVIQAETRRYEDNVLDILMENLERLWRGEAKLRNPVA